MLIGIDFDNTIINYEYAFKEGLEHLNIDYPKNLSSKNEIRDFLRNLNNGEIYWQKLQGLVYGKLLNKSGKLFNGVYRFFWRCFHAGYKVQIVSHKTEFGHFDEDKISLREEALKFLKNNFISHHQLFEQVIFKSTFQEKIDEIKNKSFSIFIDDLQEVIINISDAIPSSYLFSEERMDSDLKSKNWCQLDSEVNGIWKTNEINQISSEFTGKKPKNIIQIKNGGNSGVYKLEYEQEQGLVLKIYSLENSEKRLQTEFDALTLFSCFNIQNTPKPILKNENLGIAFYEWIDGDKNFEYTKNDILSCIKFIQNINFLKNKINLNKHTISKASAACFNVQDIENQIEKRLNDFSIPRSKFIELDLFLKNEFYPVLKKISEYVKINWNLPFEIRENIKKNELILSPSDFGFHNALKNKKDEIYFLDFEYFGWDDPVKLASDFYIHPGMSLNKNLSDFWINNFFKLFHHDHLKRFHLVKFLYWMVWPLITLNDFRDDVWLRRNLSLNSEVNRQQILSLQLNKSKNLLVQITQIFKEEVIHDAT